MAKTKMFKKSLKKFKKTKKFSTKRKIQSGGASIPEIITKITALYTEIAESINSDNEEQFRTSINALTEEDNTQLIKFNSGILSLEFPEFVPLPINNKSSGLTMSFNPATGQLTTQPVESQGLSFNASGTQIA